MFFLILLLSCEVGLHGQRRVSVPELTRDPGLSPSEERLSNYCDSTYLKAAACSPGKSFIFRAVRSWKLSPAGESPPSSCVFYGSAVFTFDYFYPSVALDDERQSRLILTVMSQRLIVISCNHWLLICSLINTSLKPQTLALVDWLALLHSETFNGNYFNISPQITLLYPN